MRVSVAAILRENPRSNPRHQRVVLAQSEEEVSGMIP
jgi:hypothetical protein